MYLQIVGKDNKSIGTSFYVPYGAGNILLQSFPLLKDEIRPKELSVIDTFGPKGKDLQLSAFISWIPTAYGTAECYKVTAENKIAKELIPLVNCKSLFEDITPKDLLVVNWRKPGIWTKKYWDAVRTSNSVL